MIFLFKKVQDAGNIYLCTMKTVKRTTVAFSGHRSFKMTDPGGDLFAARDGQTESDIYARLRETISNLAEEGFTDFLCGMAEGFDLLAGEAVLELRGKYADLRLIAVIPFPRQAVGFKPETRESYYEVLGNAWEIFTVCPQYSTDCFHRRNDYLIDNSSVLVCFYNGTRGGTQYTVKRALKNGLRIINIF